MIARDCDRCGGSTEGAALDVTDDLCLDCYEVRLAETRERVEDEWARRAYAADQRRKAAREEPDIYDDSRPDGRGADEAL